MFPEFTAGPAMLVKIAEAPLVGAWTAANGSGFKIEIEPLREFDDSPPIGDIGNGEGTDSTVGEGARPGCVRRDDRPRIVDIPPSPLLQRGVKSVERAIVQIERPAAR
jgi:hypothetical protein